MQRPAYSVQDIIDAIPGASSIRRILIVAGADLPELADWAEITIVTAPVTDLSAQRYDLAIVYRVVETLAAPAAAELLGELRNRYCQKVIVVADTKASPLDDNDLRALGFAPLAVRVELGCYLYDIDTYNEKRDWNDPGDWAHPGNFHKRRW